MKSKYDEASKELEQKEKELEKIRQAATQNDTTSEAKEKELKQNNMILGNIDVVGNGVEIVLADATVKNNLNPSLQIIHYDDLQLVVNELEAIEINGQRLVNTSAITCEGNIIKINGERIGSPFYIKAIGSQSLLYGALTRAGSIIDWIKNDGNTAEVKKVDNITISKYVGTISHDYIKESK